MDGACPTYNPDDPLVRSLLGVVDCNLQTLIQTGYAALFQPTGLLGGLLTSALVIYVALIGYQLLLGRSQLSISNFALSAVKLGAVVALATQWGAYQRLVYHVLFFGPEQLANLMARPLWHGTWADGGVFDGLQRAFSDLTSFSPATPPGAPATATPATGAGNLMAAGAGQLSTLLSKAGFDSLLLLGSAVLLLISTLGVLLASKIVLALLLALGPIFIAMMLFETTQGIFEGWLRAALAFAFAPLAVTLLLGVGLTLLEPSLEQIETMSAAGRYIPGVAFGVAVLVIVLAGVSIGLVAAGGMIAAGFKIRRSDRAPDTPRVSSNTLWSADVSQNQTRAARTASAVMAQARRDAVTTPSANTQSVFSERRMTITANIPPATRTSSPEARLGPMARRNTRPRLARSGPRADLGGVS
jgi:type IV secretion system protein VirB6